MPVFFDAVGPSSAGQGTAAVTSITWSHTCAGADRYVLHRRRGRRLHRDAGRGPARLAPHQLRRGRAGLLGGDGAAGRAAPHLR